MTYDDIKEFKGKKYSGMPIGGIHLWNYDNAIWKEQKIAPDLWKLEFRATKGRRGRSAPEGSGAAAGTEFHWFVAANQVARKVDADHYETLMTGLKGKLGHKRPHWKDFSYTYPEQQSKNQQIAVFLRKAARYFISED